MKQILLILLIIFSQNIAFGEIYKWMDDLGDLHYTDDSSKVPERYQSNIKRIESDEVTKKDENLPSKDREGEYHKDRLGRGEDYWRDRVEEWRKKTKMLQEKHETRRLRYNELTSRHNESRSSAERASLRKERDQVKSEMDQIWADLVEARAMLEKKIPEEATFYRAKPEWTN